MIYIYIYIYTIKNYTLVMYRFCRKLVSLSKDM
jgi:hypothetical protein